MDVDAVVLNDLNELHMQPIDGYAIAGVLDANPQSRHSNVGLTRDMSYINAGMILWNLEYCRQNKVVDRFAQFITERDGKIDAMDQGTINGTLSAEIKTIEPWFNSLTAFFQLTAKQIRELYDVNTYSDAQLIVARQNPTFVHFTPNMTTRPWVKDCKHPLRSEYWKYRLAVNPEYSLQDDNRPTKLKILSTLYYAAPWWLYKSLLKIRKFN